MTNVGGISQRSTIKPLKDPDCGANYHQISSHCSYKQPSNQKPTEPKLCWNFLFLYWSFFLKNFQSWCSYEALSLLCEKEQCGHDDKFVHLSDKYLSGHIRLPEQYSKCWGTLKL